MSGLPREAIFILDLDATNGRKILGLKNEDGSDANINFTTSTKSFRKFQVTPEISGKL